MQRRLEIVRFFTETVAVSHVDRMTHATAFAAKADVVPGAEAIAAGLANGLADPGTALRTCAAKPRGTTRPGRTGQQMPTTPADNPNAAPVATLPAAMPAVAALPVAPAAAVDPMSAQPTISADSVNADAAEVAQVCAQAARLPDSFWKLSALRQRGWQPTRLILGVPNILIPQARSFAGGVGRFGVVAENAVEPDESEQGSEDLRPTMGRLLGRKADPQPIE